MIEKDPAWSVYGVGIIQQGNVLRAAKQLGILDDYVAAGFGFDAVEVFAPDGPDGRAFPRIACVEGYPANLGIGRPALHQVLGDARARPRAPMMRLGVTASRCRIDGDGVDVRFSDGTTRPLRSGDRRRRLQLADARAWCSPTRRSRSSPARPCGATTCRSRPELDACTPTKAPSASAWCRCQTR